MMSNNSQCGVAKAMETIGGKWTILIVRDLLDRPRHFSELEHSLEGISPRTLAIRLKELEHDGLLKRDCTADPAHPLYRITSKGKSLSAILDDMRVWGESLAV